MCCKIYSVNATFSFFESQTPGINNRFDSLLMYSRDCCADNTIFYCVGTFVYCIRTKCIQTVKLLPPLAHLTYLLPVAAITKGALRIGFSWAVAQLSQSTSCYNAFGHHTGDRASFLHICRYICRLLLYKVGIIRLPDPATDQPLSIHFDDIEWIIHGTFFYLCILGSKISHQPANYSSEFSSAQGSSGSTQFWCACISIAILTYMAVWPCSQARKYIYNWQLLELMIGYNWREGLIKTHTVGSEYVSIRYSWS